jgi:hypothetical protein
MAKETAVGVADPSGLRDVLAAVDAAALELSAARTRLLNEIQDDFTSLGSLAPLYRELFFGVALPIRSAEELVAKLGGPDRLIEFSRRDRGSQLYTVDAIVGAIPELERCFPIRSFLKLAGQLEAAKDRAEEEGTYWFLERIKSRRMVRQVHAAAERSREAGPADREGSERFAAVVANRALLTRPRHRVSVTCCCEGDSSPAHLVAASFGQLHANANAARWTGKVEKVSARKATS